MMNEGDVSVKDGASKDRETTARGFGIYGRIQSRNGGTIRVQESSLMGEGAHVWLFLDGAPCVEHLGEHMQSHPHLSVDAARQLRDAIDAFLADAEADQLTEPGR